MDKQLQEQWKSKELPELSVGQSVKFKSESDYGHGRYIIKGTIYSINGKHFTLLKKNGIKESYLYSLFITNRCTFI